MYSVSDQWVYTRPMWASGDWWDSPTSLRSIRRVSRVDSVSLATELVWEEMQSFQGRREVRESCWDETHEDCCLTGQSKEKSNRLSPNRRDLNRPLHHHGTWRRSSCRNLDNPNSSFGESFLLLDLWQATSSLWEEFEDRCYDPTPNRLKEGGETEQEKEIVAAAFFFFSSLFFFCFTKQDLWN